MELRKTIRMIVPPIILTVIKRAFNASGASTPEYELVAGWDSHNDDEDITGWNVESVANSYRNKWPDFIKSVEGPGPLGIQHEAATINRSDIVGHNSIMTFAYIATLATSNSSSLSMLDWGGALGHFYILADKLLPDVTIDYHCRELPFVASAGTNLLPGQHFHSDDRCFLRKYDLVMAGTAFHYEEDWHSLITRLTSSTGNYLYITGLPVINEKPSFVFVQRPYSYGYNTEYLGWCFNKSEFLNFAQSIGLELVREFVVGHHPVIFNAPEQNEYRGFLFQHSRSASN